MLTSPPHLRYTQPMQPSRTARVPAEWSARAAPLRPALARARSALRRSGLDPRRTGTVGLVVYALALGGGLGLASANWATRGRYPFGGVALNAWTAWPRIGSRDADPYVRAIHARTGEIPIALGEGLLLTAREDDAGQRLSPGCSYRIAGATPPARAWTLTAERRRPAAAPAAEGPVPRRGFTSTEVLRDQSGRFAITLSPSVQPGNWLPTPPGEGALRLVLRLYDTPVAASTGVLEREGVPSITRLGCDG
ncbi:protein of unknown function DUF1214 [Methylobacterium sp. 4-46]|uniref:DUF1214 domain-containing protein n=1 Tax=unclassified Methylobacterium TaxID=2615210 RepID=UPI000165C7C7|nr:MULTISPECIES: DUF1214 domain-containing protein [Methylobacterium]ACA15644.1 protein of unknown function DUF1214 [Methylobacterium sp. 4-46]WFT81356.1 DUF1214 domain-containing protein [Methylobacterium nodulans]